jgi:hypothetical protein
MGLVRSFAWSFPYCSRESLPTTRIRRQPTLSGQTASGRLPTPCSCTTTKPASTPRARSSCRAGRRAVRRRDGDSRGFGLRPLRFAERRRRRQAGAKPRDRRQRDKIPSFDDPETGEALDLIAWAGEYGGRFEIVDALQARRPVAFLGNVKNRVKHAIRCPDEDAHSQAGADAATIVLTPATAAVTGSSFIAATPIATAATGCSSSERCWSRAS